MAALLAAAFLILLPAASAVPNVTQILTSAGQYNTYLSFLKNSYQTSTLQSQLGGNGITVFVPTDSAFQKLPAGFADNFSGLELSEFVLYHVLPNFHGDFATVQNPLYTMAGANFTFNVRVAGAQVIVSTGVVEANASPFNVSFPLALYSVDTVLQSPILFGQSTGPSTTSPPASYSPQSPAGPTPSIPVSQAPTSSSNYPAPASYSPYTPGSVAPASYSPYTSGGGVAPASYGSPYTPGSVAPASYSPYTAGGSVAPASYGSPYTPGLVAPASYSPYTPSGVAPASYSPYTPSGVAPASYSPYTATSGAPASNAPYTPGYEAPGSYAPYTPTSEAPASYAPYTPSYGVPGASPSSTLPSPASTSSVTPAPGSSSPSTDSTPPSTAAVSAPASAPPTQVGGAAAAGANLGMAAGVGLVGFLAMGLAL